MATRIQLCGRLSVEWKGVRIESALRGRQGRLLFTYLVLHRHRPVRREELVEAVWPDPDGPAGAVSLIAPLLSRLRRAVGPECLQGRSELTLLLPDDAEVDWETARAEVTRAGAAAEAGDWETARDAAAAAAAIAERGLLAGLDAPWIDERRVELADLRVEALEASARAGLALGEGRLPEAQAAARAAVEAAPFRESARVVFIGVLRARGNVAEAVRAYEDVRVLLREELGTTPGPELLALHRELLTEAERPPPAPRPAPAPTAPATDEPPHLHAAPDLVERDRELTALRALLLEARGGQGHVAVIEGPAGVGKTRLLAEARRRAVADGTLALAARAGELEREFAFGAVRQLFEAELADPARRAALLAGAARPAAAIFADLEEPVAQDGGTDVSFAALHGLFWLTLNLAAERPLVLAIDDLHWCDRPSLRFLAYLVRRLEGAPILVAATLRTGDRPTDPALLDEILSDPATVSVRPEPLSRAAVRVIVKARLGADAAEPFCAACHEVTGGNPLLLRQLLTALEADGVRPDAASVDVVQRIGPRAVSRTIGLRLARMSPDAVTVAQAIAILGDRGALPAIAALTGIDEAGVAAAVAALARAEVLRARPPLGFVHPLVRDAVYQELPVGEREFQHARAARVLADAGAPDEVVAVHLLVVPPRGDPWAAEILQRAGGAAARKGASDSAVGLMRRALEEPPPPERRSDLLLELGLTERLVDGPAAVEHLAAAHAALTDPEARGAAAAALAWTRFFTMPAPETLELSRSAGAELPEDLVDLREALEALELITIFGHGEDLETLPGRVAHRLEHPAIGTGHGAATLTAMTGWTAATMMVADLDTCVALARRSLEGGGLQGDGLFIVAAIGVLAIADQEDALTAWDATLAEAHRRGSFFLTLTAHIWRGWTLLVRGELVEAEHALREGIDELALWGSGNAIGAYPAAFLTRTMLEQGDLAAARAAVALGGGAPPESDAARLLAGAEVEVLLAEGKAPEALGLAERVKRMSHRHTNPGWAPWRTLQARCHAAVGRHVEALALAEEELELARLWGAPATVGSALRTLGTLEGAAGLAHHEEAAALLEHSTARVERARALAAVGAGRRAAGRPDAAREPLERALDLAEVCGARGLVEECRRELQAMGATPRGPELQGVAALNDVERRVAWLAADGRDPRVIAQMLYLTPRETDSHLASAYAKLGTQDAHELERALTA